MVMFSSRQPFNDDPFPWLEDMGIVLGQHRAGIRGEDSEFSDFHFAPRPEFNRPKHNPPNPILTKFREIPEGSREPWRTGFLNAAKHQRFAAWSGDEVEHAVRVLSRIGASHDLE